MSEAQKPTKSQQTTACQGEPTAARTTQYRDPIVTQSTFSQIDLTKLDLPGADLSGANLKGRDLSYSNLAGAKLRKTNLHGAKLIGVNFHEADLREAILSESVLESAKLIMADLRKADLSNAQLKGADLSDSILCYAELNRANLNQSWLQNANLAEANLIEADLRHAFLRRANLAEADLTGADLSHANLIDANLIKCQLTNTNLSDANLEGTILGIGLNHCQKAYKNQKISEWQGMRFRSQAEIKVAQALEERGLLYCPNSLTRLGNYHKSFEVDFLVCCPTRRGFRWAILEVDGYWHLPEKRAKEHERERLFEHSGVRVYRFDATLCEQDPHAVVSELMDLISI
jgi:uncharacterized protein YjbI with pentapeptide repeats